MYVCVIELCSAVVSEKYLSSLFKREMNDIYIIDMYVCVIKKKSYKNL